MILSTRSRVFNTGSGFSVLIIETGFEDDSLRQTVDGAAFLPIAACAAASLAIGTLNAEQLT